MKSFSLTNEESKHKITLTSWEKDELYRDSFRARLADISKCGIQESINNLFFSYLKSLPLILGRLGIPDKETSTIHHLGVDNLECWNNLGLDHHTGCGRFSYVSFGH